MRVWLIDWPLSPNFCGCAQERTHSHKSKQQLQEKGTQELPNKWDFEEVNDKNPKQVVICESANTESRFDLDSLLPYFMFLQGIN